jgi:hypothetical protein
MLPTVVDEGNRLRSRFRRRISSSHEYLEKRVKANALLTVASGKTGVKKIHIAYGVLGLSALIVFYVLRFTIFRWSHTLGLIVYPLLCSLFAVSTSNNRAHKEWLMYWIFFALTDCLGLIFDTAATMTLSHAQWAESGYAIGRFFFLMLYIVSDRRLKDVVYARVAMGLHGQICMRFRGQLAVLGMDCDEPDKMKSDETVNLPSTPMHHDGSNPAMTPTSPERGAWHGDERMA